MQQLLVEMADIKATLARLDERSLAADAAFTRMSDVEKRVNTLEQERGKIFGYAAGISAAASVLVGLLAWLPTIARIATG